MTLLPCGCAVYGTAAATFLDNHGIRCRLISIQLVNDRHILCLFNLNGRLRAYDPQGTRTLPKGLTLDSHPKAIAKAWLHIAIFKKNQAKKLQAHWY
jgi:hypothetical protein